MERNLSVVIEDWRETKSESFRLPVIKRAIGDLKFVQSYHKTDFSPISVKNECQNEKLPLLLFPSSNNVNKEMKRKLVYVCLLAMVAGGMMSFSYDIPENRRQAAGKIE